MAMIVNLESLNNRICTVKIKREVSSSIATREFSKKGLEEYLESARAYCEHKGYAFIFNDNNLMKEHDGKREGAVHPELGTTKEVSLTIHDDI